MWSPFSHEAIARSVHTCDHKHDQQTLVTSSGFTRHAPSALCACIKPPLVLLQATLHLPWQRSWPCVHGLPLRAWPDMLHIVLAC